MSARSYVRSVQAITFSALAIVIVAGTWLTAHHPTSVALNVSADLTMMLTCAFFLTAMVLPRRALRRRIARRESELARLRSAFDAAGETIAIARARAHTAEQIHGPDSAAAVTALQQWQQAAYDQQFTAIIHDETVTAIRADQQWLTEFRIAATPAWLTRLRRRREIRHLAARSPRHPNP